MSKSKQVDLGYKCVDHKLNFACLGCVRAWIKRHDAMLSIVKRASKNNCCICCDDCLSCDALELLESFGIEK